MLKLANPSSNPKPDEGKGHASNIQKHTEQTQSNVITTLRKISNKSQQKQQNFATQKSLNMGKAKQQTGDRIWKLGYSIKTK